MKIVIPEIPPSLNKILRMHYHERDRENKKWAGLIGFFCNKKHKLNIQKAKVTITYYFPDNRRRDPDNFAGKFILDGLTNSGVIEDDSFKNVELVLVGKVDKKDPRTEIKVEEITI